MKKCVKANLFLSTILMCLTLGSRALPFCHSKSFDSVFNVGHVIHFVRCGQIWTFDPQMDGQSGGFFKDWSLFVHSRHWFGANLIKRFGTFKDEWLRFNGFSFQDITCLKHEEDFNKTCFRSIHSWNGLTVLFDNISAVPFYYGQPFKADDNHRNPLGFDSRQKFKNSDNFLPKVQSFIPSSDPKRREFVSALYDNDEEVLYMGLKYDNLYCITYLNVKQMVHNSSEWPSVKPKDWSPDWRPAKCFSGNIIGMFYHKRQAYVVGRVRYESRVYEDQVYTMSAIGRESVQIGDIFYKTSDPQNLRTFFGCSKDKLKSIKRKRSVKEDVEPIRDDFNTTLIKLSNNRIILITLSLIVLVMYSAIIFSLFIKIRNKT